MKYFQVNTIMIANQHIFSSNLNKNNQNSTMKKFPSSIHCTIICSKYFQILLRFGTVRQEEKRKKKKNFFNQIIHENIFSKLNQIFFFNVLLFVFIPILSTNSNAMCLLQAVRYFFLHKYIQLSRIFIVIRHHTLTVYYLLFVYICRPGSFSARTGNDARRTTHLLVIT